MNQSAHLSQKTGAASADHLTDAVWDFMTSLKRVKKRDGTEVDFDPAKLKASIERAFERAGTPSKAQEVLEQVVGRLQRIYDGHTVPNTSDILEVTALTLIDNNQIHVAKAYMSHKQRLAPENNGAPVYGKGISVARYFTKPNVHPFDAISWELRTASIKNEKGEVIFEQTGIETPSTWSQTAVNIVAQKYFRGQVGKPDRESSMKQLISRVATTIANWGRKDGYFLTVEDAQAFEDELTHILINQMAAFNSPVWFNVGVHPHPQCSA